MSQLDITAWTQSACEKTLTNTANIDQWRRGRSITGSTHGSRKAEDKAQDKIKLGTRQNAERADRNGDNLRIYRAYLRISDHCSLIRLGLGLGLGLALGLGFGLWFGGIGLGLRIVVYKLLEKVTKCGSITRLKLRHQRLL